MPSPLPCLLVALVTFLTAPFLSASATPGSRLIEFPDLPGYVTLVCDFHQHSVFSDGDVWPHLRVQESLRDGLDAMALTDHIEYQPRSDDLPHPDRNRSNELARAAAQDKNILFIAGAEITRSLPPGHLNVLFIQNANTLRDPDPVAVLREAGRQGAFIFWNHPSWLDQTPDGVARFSPLHEQLLQENLLHGIEVANGRVYSDEALQIALDRNLTILGNSDIHGFADWTFPAETGAHRPVTLVFAREKTEAALKEALFDRRTVVWFKNTLIGRAGWLDPLLAASLTVTRATYRAKSTVLDLTVANASDAHFILRNVSSYRFHDHADVVEVKPHGTVNIGVKTLEPLARIEVAFEVLNAVTAPAVHPTLTLAAQVATP